MELHNMGLSKGAGALEFECDRPVGSPIRFTMRSALLSRERYRYGLLTFRQLKI